MSSWHKEDAKELKSNLYAGITGTIRILFPLMNGPIVNIRQRTFLNSYFSMNGTFNISFPFALSPIDCRYLIPTNKER